MAFTPNELATEMGVRLHGADYVKSLAPVDNRTGWSPWVVAEPFSGAWQKDVQWSTDTVLAYHAVYSCISLISADIGKLRLKLMQIDDDGIWTETTSPAYSPVLKRPNRYQNHIQFTEWWITSKLIRGNSYALKQRDNRGVVTDLYLLDSSLVTVLVATDGSIFYQLNADNLSGLKGPLTVPASEIIHDRMNCIFHPLIGTSPIFACGSAANQGLKIEKNQSGFFANGSNPSGILTAPGSISDETAKRLKDHWTKNYTGDNAGKVAIVGDGLKFEPMRMSAVDSQLIEQLKWSAEVVCSTFHVPPYMIGVGPAPSYNNIEALSQQYYSQCLQSLIEAFEESMDDGLGMPDKYDTRLDLDGLLRMDTATQYTTLGTGVDKGILGPNEARKRLNYKPVAGGDTPYMQQQNYSLAALDERDKTNPLAVKPSPAPVPPPEPDQTDKVLHGLFRKSPEAFSA